MAKNINIHLKTRGAEQTKQQLDDVGRKTRQLGDTTAEGQRHGADAVDKTTQKMTGMGRVLSNLKSQVLGFVGGFLGLQAVIKLVDYLQQKLQRIQQIQEQLYQSSVTLSGMGQALEFQTGTLGQQQFWTEMALRLQTAGGLPSPEVAQQMMISMDIAFAKQGGIKSKQIQDLAKQLAPFVGAAGLGPEEVAKLFEFAGTAGIAPDEQAYKDYFAKVQAGYTASKATSFGRFMEGLQKGGTAYMSMGGTLEEAISAFAAARSVMANEQLAATLVEQVARLSSGAYAKPRQAIESKLGVKWQDLAMDERMAALLQYVEAIPEATRGEVLAEQGFPVELSTQMGKMVSDEAKKVMEATRDIVAKAVSDSIDRQTQAYMVSLLGIERKTEAEITLKKTEKAPELADWSTRIKKARGDFDLLLETGQDRWVKDSIEPYLMALETLEKDITEALTQAPPETKIELLKLRATVRAMNAQLSDFWTSWRLWPSMVARQGLELTQMLESISRGEPYRFDKTMWDILEGKQPKIEVEEIEPIETEPVELPPPVSAPPQSVEPSSFSEIKPVSKETEIEVPVQPVAKETEVEVPVEPIVKETEVEVPVEIAAAKKQQVEVPIEAGAGPQQVKVPVEVATIGPQQVEVPVQPIVKETEVEVPVYPVAKETTVEVPIRPVAKEAEVEVPVEPVAKETEVEVPVQPVVKEAELEVPVQPVAKEAEVEVPVEAGAGPQRVEVPVEIAGAEQQQVEVPVVASAQRVTVPVEAEAEPVAVPVIAPSAPVHEKIVHQTVNTYNYIYDHSMRFHPRVGDDEVGPRIPGGVIV